MRFLMDLRRGGWLDRGRWLSGVLALTCPPLLAQQAEPEAGLVALRQACLDAATDAVIMNIAAHPDDESSRTNTILRRKYGARVVTAYSTYGGGGQNAIGKEIGPALARLRVRETLRASAMMDVDVRWLGMSDFGFSKTLEETLEVWGAERLRSAMRKVIDEIEPAIIITNHNIAQGHGHHRASYWAIVEVLKERAAAGRRVPPLYVRSSRAKAQLTLDPAELDTVRGETFARLAHRAWTQHVTQGPWGSHNPLRVGKDNWRVVFPETVPPEQAADVQHWVENSRQAGLVQRLLDSRGDQAVAAIRKIAGERLQDLIADAGADESLRARRRDAIQRILLADAGVRVEAWLEHEEVPRGGEGKAYVVVHGAEKVERLRVSCNGVDAEVLGPQVRRRPLSGIPAQPAGAGAKTGSGAGSGAGSGDGSGAGSGDGSGGVAADSAAGPAPTQATAVATTVVGGRYAVRFAHEAAGGGIEGPEPAWIELEVSLVLDGVEMQLRPTLPYTPVEPVAMAWDRSFVMVPQGQVVERVLSATVKKYRAGDLAEPVRLMMGPGIKAIAAPGRLNLTNEHPEARLLVRATFTVEDLASEPSLRIGVGDHTAELAVVPVEVFVPPGLTVGLVRGPDDTLERTLADLGVSYTALDRDALATTRLQRFTTLLLDMRAYHHRPELAEVRDRILQFCRAGGRVVSMYHKPGEWNQRAGHPLLAPFPVSVGRGRVTEEDAPITMLAPGHRLWTYPHEIDEQDFAGWVQERGLNFPSKWDQAWTPLIEMKDRGDKKPHQGALLYTQYGRGDFVYCSLVLYRQLRTGHAGAARLLVNLLAR